MKAIPRVASPIAFVLTSTDHGVMIVNRNDYHQLPNGAIYGVGHQLLTNGCYDPGEIADVLDTLAVRRSVVGDGLVVVDCGANIGVHTLEMARFMTGWGEVFAFEAQSRLYYALCGNIALNNVENATAYWVALGDEVGTIEIPKVNYNKPASFGSLELQRRPDTEYIGQTVSYAPRVCNKISLSKLDTYDWNRVDFIKIDVEGMELAVLEGGKETIARFRPHMLIEWIKTDRQQLQNMLEDFGYDFVEAGGNLKASPRT